MTRIASNESKLSKCIKAPYRALLKARDIYVRSMIECSGGVSYGGNLMGYPSTGLAPSSLPKSYSSSTTVSRSSSRMSTDYDYDNDDYRELLRAASQRDQRTKSSFEPKAATTTTKKSSKDGLPPLPRSFTVGIGRIDEDKPCDFDESFMVMKTDGLYPRSKSYAVTKMPNGVLA